VSVSVHFQLAGCAGVVVGSRSRTPFVLAGFVPFPAATETDPSPPVVRQDRRAESEAKKGAACFPQAGDNLWRLPTRGAQWAKALRRRDGGSWMEGTSGAADLGSLRGESGEAALGPG
jgi:hypothetical protein